MERIPLLKLIDDLALVPSVDEDIAREEVIAKLKKIVMEWAKRVSCRRRLPSSHTEAASATIMTYGSYSLGVHSSESDIDALCVGPSFATRVDFFTVLYEIIACKPEVSDLHYIEGARGPIMCFSFDGILIDLSYAELNISSFPENVNVDDPCILRNMDTTSWRSFSRVFANKKILQLVPNLESYRLLLRVVKHWAKVRGIYGNFVGYLGGTDLAVLTALISQRHPTDPLCALILAFFKTFAYWPWPQPVSLDGTEFPPGSSSTQSSLMRIQLPHGLYKYCPSSITRSAFYRIREELLLGHYLLTKDAPRPDFDWKILFRPFLPAQNYVRLFEIRLSSSHQDDLEDWVGLVKFHMHYLLVKLEELHYICDPNPTQYVDGDFLEPNIVFYWGLRAGGNYDIDYGSMKEDFMKNIQNGYDHQMGKMELQVVRRVSLGLKTASKNIKTCWRVADSSSLC